MTTDISKLVAAGTPGEDIIHGMMKNWMYDAEQKLNDLAPKDTVFEYDYLSGYLDALAEVYKLTYEISFAVKDLTNTSN